MKTLRLLVAACLSACLFTFSLLAAGTGEASPAGIWKWSQQGRDGQSFERKLKLEYHDGKLSGEILAGEGPMGPTPAAPLEAATFKDGVVAFSVTRTFNGVRFTIKYEGKLDGEVIKGTTEFPGRDGGEPTKRDWIATRVK